MEATTATSRPGPIVALRSLALAAAGVAAVLALWGELGGAGIAVAVAAAAVAAGDAARGPGRHVRVGFVTSVSSRLVDALILGSVAWAMFEESVAAGVAGVTALSSAFVASYLLVKGLAMGFRMSSWPWLHVLRLALVAAALLTPLPGPVLWLAAGIGALEAVAHTARLARQEEPS